MLTFIISLLVLIAGYFFYGSFVEKCFGIDETAETPAIRPNDGVVGHAKPVSARYVRIRTQMKDFFICARQ